MTAFCKICKQVFNDEEGCMCETFQGVSFQNENWEYEDEREAYREARGDARYDLSKDV